MFQDKREVTINGKTFIIRQRCLQDIINIEKAFNRYKNNSTGQAVLLAFAIRDAIRYDNFRCNIPIVKRLFPISIRWILKRFSLATMQLFQEEMTKLETYSVKKKDLNAQAGV